MEDRKFVTKRAGQLLLGDTIISDIAWASGGTATVLCSLRIGENGLIIQVLTDPLGERDPASINMDKTFKALGA